MASVRQGLREPPEGTMIFHQEPNELLLDLDTVESMQQFIAMLPHLEEEYPVKRVWIWASRSKGAHAVVQLQSWIEEAERYLLQAVLGSDPLRELLNWYDWKKHELPAEHTNVLFKPIREEADNG